MGKMGKMGVKFSSSEKITWCEMDETQITELSKIAPVQNTEKVDELVIEMDYVEMNISGSIKNIDEDQPKHF